MLLYTFQELRVQKREMCFKVFRLKTEKRNDWPRKVIQNNTTIKRILILNMYKYNFKPHLPYKSKSYISKKNTVLFFNFNAKVNVWINVSWFLIWCNVHAMHDIRSASSSRKQVQTHRQYTAPDLTGLRLSHTGLGLQTGLDREVTSQCQFNIMHNYGPVWKCSGITRLMYLI